jgi:chromosome segregation ATPase
MGQADVCNWAKIMPHGFVFHWEKCIIMAIIYRIKDMGLAVRARMRLVKKLEKRFNDALEELELGASATADRSEVDALSKQLSDLKEAQAEKSETIATLKSQAADLSKQSQASVVQIGNLKKAQIEKDATIATLTAQVAELKKTNAATAEKNADVSAAQAEHATKVATLTSQLTDLRKQNEAAAIRISSLKDATATAKDESAKNLAAVTAAQAAEALAAKKVTKLKGKLEKARADTSGSAETLSKMEDLEDEVEGLQAQLAVSEANALKHYEKMRRLRGAHRAVRAGLKGNVLNEEDVNTAMEAELEAVQMQREIDVNEVNIVLEKLTPLVEGK